MVSKSKWLSFDYIIVIREKKYGDCKKQYKNVKTIFGYVCAASTELNTVFSFPALAFLVARLILSSLLLYVSIYGVMSDNEFLKEVLPITVIICFIGCANIFAILRSADLLINQVQK